MSQGWLLCLGGILVAYLWHCNRSVTEAPPEAERLAQNGWTEAEMDAAYERANSSPPNVKPYLFSKKDRRYIVVGGSGLVAGWIVQHLLMRGEDPVAIRVLDISPPTRPEILEHNIRFIKTDVRDPQAVADAFSTSWPEKVKSLPLTVFHCVAFIGYQERKAVFTPVYKSINIDGTRHVLTSARQANASIFIYTSSSAVAAETATYFTWPWQRWHKTIFQFHPNADRVGDFDDPVEKYASCYAWSKGHAEKLVRDADDPSTGFRTGAIRPTSAIYGPGVDASSSVIWDYLNRGGSPSWLWGIIMHFVSAQNVSIGHLAFEDALSQASPKVGGKAFAVSDPNPPIQFRTMYSMLQRFTSIRFTVIPHVPMLLLAYMIELYQLFVFKYASSILPAVKGDLAIIQPATWAMCTTHSIFTDTKAQEEIGYKAPIKTIDGFAVHILDWNRRLDAKPNPSTSNQVVVEAGQPHIKSSEKHTPSSSDLPGVVGALEKEILPHPPNIQ